MAAPPQRPPDQALVCVAPPADAAHIEGGPRPPRHRKLRDLRGGLVVVRKINHSTQICARDPIACFGREFKSGDPTDEELADEVLG